VLIGREFDLERLRESIERSRLVTLAGPGGVGKTTLARVVLDERVERRAFVDLVSVSSDGMLESVAGALGFVSFADLVRVVGDDDWLLVMDNCEHVLDPAAAVVETLLDSCPGLTVLATSREPLALGTEVVLRVEPLGLDGDPSPAAELFLERAAARGVTDGIELPDVEALVRRLDGLPLAIELAAAKSAAMTPSEISERLTASLDAIDRTRARGPARHRGLAATITWSFDQLEEPLDVVCVRLAVFEGRFSVGMATAAVGELVDDVHDTLVALTERSLLIHESLDGRSWFRMLDTIRTFGLEQLGAAEHEEIWERIVGHVVAELVDLGRRPIMGGAELQFTLRHGFSVIRAVARHCVAHDETAGRALALTKPLWWLEDIGHQTEASDLIGEIVARWPEPTPPAGMAYAVRGAFLRLARRVDEAARASRVAISSGDPVAAAMAHRTLGHIARNRSEWADAIAHYEAGVTAARSVDEVAFALEIDMHIAMTHARMGEVERGLARLRRLEVESRPHALCHNWIRLFMAWVLMPIDHAEARAVAEAVIAERDHESSSWALATAQVDLGVAAGLDGDLPTAAHHLAESLERFVDINNTTDVALVYSAAAATLNAAGDTDGAQQSAAMVERLDLGAFGPFEMEMYDRIGGLPDADRKPSEVSWVRVRDALRRVAAGSPARLPDAAGATFRRSGDHWLVGLGREPVPVSDSKGMADLAELLARPGREIAALDLMGAEVVGGDAGALSDATARVAYQDRIRELQDEIDSAMAGDDVSRLEAAQDEMDRLVTHLSAAYGLGGRARQSGDHAEKARSAVTWRIRSTIKRLRDVAPEVADHLDRSVRTGRFCVYDPSEPIAWRL
jgi:predicted ATPase